MEQRAHHILPVLASFTAEVSSKVNRFTNSAQSDVGRGVNAFFKLKITINCGYTFIGGDSKIGYLHDFITIAINSTLEL